MRFGIYGGIIAVFAFYLILGISFAGGLGIAPSEVNFPGMMRGGYAETFVTLSNPNDVATTVAFTAKGETKDYITFMPVEPSYIESPTQVVLESGEVATAYLRLPKPIEPVSEITIPANTNKDLIIIAKTPADIQVGTYLGVITFNSHPHLEEGVQGQFGTSIAVAVEIPLSLELTGDQKLDLVIGSIQAKDAEVGYPLEILVSGENRGNVRVSPQVHVEILDRDRTRIIKSADFDGSEYLPTTRGTDRFEVSSDGMNEGQYWANVTVTLAGKTLKQEIVTFDILAPGAMSRKGELVQLSSKVWAKPGEVVRVEALFRNTGEITVNAKFKGEVTLDGQIVGVVETEELLVPPGEEANLTAYFTPELEGRYVISGKGYYSGKVTYMKEVILNVSNGVDNVAESSFFSPTLILIIIIAVLMAILSKV